MIPLVDTLVEQIQEVEYYDKTHKIIIQEDRVAGWTEGIDAVKQAIYLILNTERYMFPIYSWDYGVEFVDLIGAPFSYVMSEIPRRIEEALTMDDRIESCSDFEFEKNGKDKLHVTFTVNTIYGVLSSELEVNI